MAGPLADSDVTISIRSMNRILVYEPADLTISVEAGISYGELTQTLAAKRQMIPLDPPFAEDATIGGIIAANCSGPRRRHYGTARDMVIGMTFTTLEGKVVQTGGMVVKNVAGLDLAKLMIGSFGTLAVIAVVNFKLHPIPESTRTFGWTFSNVADAIRTRDSVLKSMLQPTAIDLIKTGGEYRLLVQAGGNASMLDRYARELPGAEVLQGASEANTWQAVREFAPAFLAQNENGAVLRISCKLTEVGTVLESVPGPAIARAGSGVVYAGFSDSEQAMGRGVVEYASQRFRMSHELWPRPGDDFEMMKKIKAMLDPYGLLNAGRLYGRI